MFASGSSHASSYYKDSWICVSQEKKKRKKKKLQPTKSALLDDMHWDLMMPPPQKRNTNYVLQINEIHIDQLVFVFFVQLLQTTLKKRKKKSRFFVCLHFLSQQSYKLLHESTVFNTGLQWSCTMHIRFTGWFGSRVGFRFGLRLQVRMEVWVLFRVQCWSWESALGLSGVGVPKTSLSSRTFVEHD